MSTGYVPITTAAEALSVPRAWLRREALAGNLPSLRVGRRLLFSIDSLRTALAERERDPRAATRKPAARGGRRR